MASLPANVSLANIADGAAIVASDHRNNYSALQTYINALNAILAGGSAGQVLGSSGGTTVGWTNGTTNYRKATAKTVASSIAATDLLNSEITIAAAAMGATGVLRLTAWGDWLNSSGGSVALPRFQALLGGTPVIDTAAPGSVVTGATRYDWNLELLIQNATATSQTVRLRGEISSGANSVANTSFATGTGLYQEIASGVNAFHGVNSGLTVATGSACALALNVINGSNSASYETKLFGALVEII